MSKKIKEAKPSWSTPKFPDIIYVVELDEYVLLTDVEVPDECIFTYYKFVNDADAAYDAVDDIAKSAKKLVINAVDFWFHDPLVYDPIEVEESLKRITKTLEENACFNQQST